MGQVPKVMVQEVVRQVPRVQVQEVVKQLPAPVTTVQAAPVTTVQAAPVMETIAPTYAAPVVETIAPTYAAPTTFGTATLAAPTIGAYGAPTIGTSYGTVL